MRTWLLLMLALTSVSGGRRVSGQNDSQEREFGELTELGKVLRKCLDQSFSERKTLAQCLRNHKDAEGRSARKEGKRRRKSFKWKKMNLRKKVKCGEMYFLRAGEMKVFRLRPRMGVCSTLVQAVGETELVMNCKTFNLSACRKEYFFVSHQKFEKQYCRNKGPGKIAGLVTLYLLYERAKKSKDRSRIWCSIKAVERSGCNEGGSISDTQVPGCDNVCGRAPESAGVNRIVGGQEAEVGEYPWMARLEIRSGDLTSYCGGSIVTATHVITAGHCVDEVNTDVIVTAGKHDIQLDQENNTQVFKAKQILRHPQFSATTSENDIALITLLEPLEWTPYVGPICLPPDADFEDRMAIVTGWGSLAFEGPKPSKLNEVAVVVTDQESCKEAYSQSVFLITNNTICAADSGKDACQGDSGGPLVIKENGIWVLIGIVSFGRGCAMEGFPGVYTRVSSYNSWILSSMALGSC
ncbi:chymotrypsinogen B-like [Penaeus japonicus]|uniref:chymotrypsinogen B-like n=1 Tax=Penaeus japonicus TaxID=27405 RepID=UPI001C715196|nr:chymotrypsinogen B-like [Penaeus japonicus]